MNIKSFRNYQVGQVATIAGATGTVTNILTLDRLVVVQVTAKDRPNGEAGLYSEVFDR